MVHSGGATIGHRGSVGDVPRDLAEEFHIELIEFIGSNRTRSFRFQASYVTLRSTHAACYHAGMTRYERVHAIWDLYDGVRTGIADLNDVPHYFASLYDEGADDYSDNFRLFPVSSEFMRSAMRNWVIYRAWDRRFRIGETDLTTHPGHGGINAEYDQLKSWLNDQIASLQALPTLYRAHFRELPDQESLPSGMLRDLEVVWSPLPD